MDTVNRLSRRHLLKSVAAAPFLMRAQAPSVDHGLVKPPIPLPDLKLSLQDGSLSSLPRLFEGHATAIQLMFTECRTTCPIQGAIFERVQELVPDQVKQGIQLVSLSIDPRSDTPEALAAWLKRFHAHPGWIAASPQPSDLERVRAFFGAGRSASDDHSTRVHLVNRNGLLVWRTFELPSAEEVASILTKL